MRKKGQAR